MEDPRPSPLDGLIDMEIQLRDIEQADTDRIRALTEGPSPELVQAAENVFAPHMFDPILEKGKVSDIVDFAFRDCGAENPADFLNLITRMQRNQGRDVLKHNALDALWIQVQQHRARKAVRNLAS